MGTKFSMWTFIAGGIVGGLISYMLRGELEKVLPKLGGSMATPARVSGAYYAPMYRRR